MQNLTTRLITWAAIAAAVVMIFLGSAHGQSMPKTVLQGLTPRGNIVHLTDGAGPCLAPSLLTYIASPDGSEIHDAACYFIDAGVVYFLTKEGKVMTMPLERFTKPVVPGKSI